MRRLKPDHDRESEVQPPCKWCADEGPLRTTYGEKLCGSCRHIAEQQRRNAREGDSFAVAVYREMERLARGFGERYRSAVESAEGLDLEYALAAVSRLICHKDLYHGLASYLHHKFDPDQRRALIELLFKAIRKGESRRRHMRAAYSPDLDWMPTGLAKRIAARKSEPEEIGDNHRC